MINNHSGICWIKENEFEYSRSGVVDYMTFFVLDLREEKPKIKSYKLKDTFNRNKALFSSRISDVW